MVKDRNILKWRTLADELGTVLLGNKKEKCKHDPYCGYLIKQIIEGKMNSKQALTYSNMKCEQYPSACELNQ